MLALELATSNLQFGFTEKTSTTHFTFVVEEVINYYVKNGSSIYVTLLYASKAFDRVQYDKLFKILSERKMCAIIMRFLCSMYINQMCPVKWSDSISSKFIVENGVKQGGVLSPKELVAMLVRDLWGPTAFLTILFSCLLELLL